LFDRLAAKFTEDNIFMDVDSIQLGLDFKDVLETTLNSCVVMIVVIGKNWLGARNSVGQCRLDDPDDYVRLEIEIALRRNIRVIPILVEGAVIPGQDDLPPSIKPLTRRNGRDMSHARFGSDCLELISTIEQVLKERRKP